MIFLKSSRGVVPGTGYSYLYFAFLLAILVTALYILVFPIVDSHTVFVMICFIGIKVFACLLCVVSVIFCSSATGSAGGKSVEELHSYIAMTYRAPTRGPTRAPVTRNPSTKRPTARPATKRPTRAPTRTLAPTPSSMPTSAGNLGNVARCQSNNPFTCGANDPSTCYFSVGCMNARDNVLSAAYRSNCTGRFADNADVGGVCAYKGIQWVNVCYNPSSTAFSKSVSCSDGTSVYVYAAGNGYTFIPACSGFRNTCTCPIGLMLSTMSCSMLSPTGVPTSMPTKKQYLRKDAVGRE